MQMHKQNARKIIDLGGNCCRAHHLQEAYALETAASAQGSQIWSVQPQDACCTAPWGFPALLGGCVGLCCVEGTELVAALCPLVMTLCLPPAVVQLFGVLHDLRSHSKLCQVREKKLSMLLGIIAGGSSL